MEEITKEICVATRKTLQASIGESIEVNGMPLGVTVGNISYGGDEMTVKVIIRAAHYKPEEVKQLEWMLETYNLDPKAEDANGCRLYGYKPRRKKMPWTIKNDAGEMFSCSDEYVTRWFWDLAAYDNDSATGQLDGDRTCFQMRNMVWSKRDDERLNDLADKFAKIGGAPAGKKKAKKKSKKKAARKSK